MYSGIKILTEMPLYHESHIKNPETKLCKTSHLIELSYTISFGKNP